MATFELGQSRFPKVRGPYVAYLRYSDRPHTKLRIDAQEAAIKALLSPGRAHLVAVFREREPTRMRDRAELAKAISVCKEHGATLIFGKLGGMRGSVGLLDQLFEQRIKFRCGDVPQLYNSSFYRLKSLDYDRRRKASTAIRAALAKAKSGGRPLGGARENSEGLMLGPAASAAARKRKARSRDMVTMQRIKSIQREGITSLSGIAARLNEEGSNAPRGGSWNATQVRRVIGMFSSEADP